MGAFLAVGAFLVVAVLGAAAFLRFVVADPEPSEMTATAIADVQDRTPERNALASPRQGFRVTYAYDAGGSSWTDDAWVPERMSSPLGGTVVVCVDPDDPALHEVPSRPGARCGDQNLGRNDEQRAEPARP